MKNRILYLTLAFATVSLLACRAASTTDEHRTYAGFFPGNYLPADAGLGATVIGNDAGTWSVLKPGTTNQVLQIMNGAPAWGAGGGGTTLPDAGTGGLWYQNDAGAVTPLAAGGLNQSLLGGGAGAPPFFGTVFPGGTGSYPISFVAPPNASAFTIVNGGAATLTTSATGALVFQAPPAGSTSNNRRVAVVATPATPYTLTVGMFYNMGEAVFSLAGVVLRESSTGKLITFDFYVLNTGSLHIELNKFTNPTTASGSNYQDFQTLIPDTGFICWHIKDDGTNISWLRSSDCVVANAIQIDKRLRTDFLASGPNQIGIIIDPFNNSTSGFVGSVSEDVVHWIATSP